MYGTELAVLTLPPYPGLVACSVWDVVRVTAAGIEPATVIMNHGAAALLVYGNYSTTNKDLDGVILYGFLLVGRP